MYGGEKRLRLAVVVALVLAAGLATAQQIPHKINYQGRITHVASGIPLPGTHNMTFRIYDALVGGSLLWTEDQTVQADFQGVVSTILGDVTPIDLTFEEPYWLEVVVDGETLVPRREMVSSGYAYNAERLGGRMSSSYSLVDHAHHTLEAADGSPTEAVYVDADGNVGIGTTSPSKLLDVAGDIQSNELFLGSPLQDGNLHVYENGATDPVALIGSYSSQGGAITLFDEKGNTYAHLAPDAQGSGGWFSVSRHAGSSGLWVDGNHDGTEEPRVSLTGSSQAVVFDFTESGDESVQLPPSSVSRRELRDEPGAGAATNPSSIELTPGAISILASRTIHAPDDGYVLVIGTCHARADHVLGVETHVEFGVSTEDASFPANQRVAFYLPVVAASGMYVSPVTVQSFFSVDPGENTFYLLAHEQAGHIYAGQIQLSIIYLPTSYGVVSTSAPGAQAIPDEHLSSRRSLTSQEIVAEQAESEAFNTARMEREMAEMRARLEALESESQGQNR